ncbi:MAG: hypothetical protein Q9204_003612 [Flavoplaca sp. TL-2023a]
MEDKQSPTSSASNKYEYDAIDKAGNPWQPGLFRRAPWLGLGAMLGALLGILAAIIILKVSDGQPIQNWSVQPTVYLAIATAATNIFLHYALIEAVAIFWWARALKKDTTPLGALTGVFSTRNFSIAALASVLVPLVPINRPFLQRASRVTQGHFEQSTDVNINIASRIPEGFTGYLSNRAYMPALLAAPFVQIVQGFNQRSPISIVDSGCRGICNTDVSGAGLVANCSDSDFSFELDPNEAEDPDQVINGTDVFGTYLLWPSAGNGDLLRDMMVWPVMTPGTFNLGVQYKSSADCGGSLVTRNCTVRPATVMYPVSIDGNRSSISLATGSTIRDDRVVKIDATPQDPRAPLSKSLNMSTYGGFFKTLSDTYESTLHMDYGAIGYQIQNQGALANQYLSTSDNLRELEYSLSFRDPTDDILADMRELMFRTAVRSAQAADVQQVTTLESFDTPVFRSNYRFLAIAVLFSVLGWLATIPVFLGWWHLGRAVSLSPIETAKAFGAPGLGNRDSNADARAILKATGKHEVRYGISSKTRPGGDSDGLKQSSILTWVIRSMSDVQMPERRLWTKNPTNALLVWELCSWLLESQVLDPHMADDDIASV